MHAGIQVISVGNKFLPFLSIGENQSKSHKLWLALKLNSFTSGLKHGATGRPGANSDRKERIGLLII